MLLQIQNCSISFGGIKALTRFSALLSEGELLGIIGPNGAGKTTLFNLLTGIYVPDEGEFFLQNRSLKGLSSYQINRLGLSRTFQNIRLFQNLSVQENVLIAYHHQIHSPLWKTILCMKSVEREEARIQKKAFDLLELFGLLEKRFELAKNLAYGDQRKLEIVRALATSPRVLLLDEPAAGMNPTEKKELIQLIRQIQEEFRLSMILIEHDMNVVMTLCPRIIVLDYGLTIATGSPDQIRRNPQVIEAYLGGSFQS